jgi:hypothetical protein
MTPRSRKSGYGLLLGCRSGLDGGLFEKLFFDDVRKKNWPKTGKFFIVCFDPPSQSIGRGRLSREGALDVRESRERRDKIVPMFSPEKQEKRNFGLSRIQLAPHARRRDVPMIVSERMPASCTGDEVAKSGRTGMTTAYTEDMFSRERTMDYIMHRLLGENTIY